MPCPWDCVPLAQLQIAIGFEDHSQMTQRFEGNFRQFEGHVGDSVKAAAIRAAA